MPKTLDQLAMEYAIVSLGVDPNKHEGLFDLSPTVTFSEWCAADLKDRMCRQYNVYTADQAIKRAIEIVRMVIPDQDKSDA